MYKEIYEAKKGKEKLKWERQVMEAKTEEQVWKIVNRERKRKKWMNEGIEMAKWDEYFKGLLRGVEWRVIKGSDRGEKEDEEKELTREEVEEMIKKLKDGKAMEEDGIPNKVWKYGRKEVERWIWELYIAEYRGGMERKSFNANRKKG